MTMKQGIGCAVGMLVGRHFVASLAILAGLIGLCPSANADVYTGKGRGGANRTELPSIKSAEDAIEKLPFFSKIPKSFIVGDGFKFKFSGQELRIDHMGLNSKAPANKRICMIGLSFASPVAFFGSKFELPLFYSEHIRLSQWNANTPGDYVVRFSKDSTVEHPTIGLTASARF